MEQDHIGYEYKKVKIPSEQLALYADAYESFGWQMDERLSDLSSDGLITLRFRRGRKIMNKMELTRLERNFEGCTEQIARLEKEKTKAARSVSFMAGIIGTAFLAGATFAAVAAQPKVLLCILLAVPGFIGWILPHFLYRHIVKKKTAAIEPLIDKKYDEIDELMKKGHALL